MELEQQTAELPRALEVMSEMAKRNLEEKRNARAAREARKVRAAEDRAEFRRRTNSCSQCGSVLEELEMSVAETGKRFTLTDNCPRCGVQA